MSVLSLPSSDALSLARQARKRFVHAMDGCCTELAAKVQSLLSALMTSGAQAPSRENKTLVVETARMFHSEQRNWMATTHACWHHAMAWSLNPAPAGMADTPWDGMTPADDAAMALTSHLAGAVREITEPAISELKRRILHLEQTNDWPSHDVLRPETLTSLLIQAWFHCGLTRRMWELVLPAIRSALIQRLTRAYRSANDFLSQNGVLAAIAPKRRLRDGRSSGEKKSSPAKEHADAAYADTQPDDRLMPPRDAPGGTGAQTAMPPLARIRDHAHGMLEQLRRLIGERIDGNGAPTTLTPRLQHALVEEPMPFPITTLTPEQENSFLSALQVEGMAIGLREQTNGLKTQTEKPRERATIEIVALMFQAILCEDRIAPSIKVWFARLQMPVLRLALTEPDFFGSETHPARQLIDRMGACALGFDAAQINGSQLEREIKRIVQTVEQYPDAGRRVYELMLREFEKFLGHSLPGTGAAREAATLAQQIEQKEALAVHYTIELNRMLAPVPIDDTVREFLFRVWSDVLALAAVRHGPRHAETLRFKQAAVDLLRTAGQRFSLAEHALVARQFADVIVVLREGMTMLGMAGAEQDKHIELLNQAVTQALTLEAQGMSQSTLDELANKLDGLEDVVSDDPEGEVLLDPQMIDLMFGSAGAHAGLEVISAGGLPPTSQMVQWAREQELGAWFYLGPQGAASLVEYVWRSARGQLHLLTNSAGKSYLMQTHRMAAYRQAGLLTPVEDEALTVRATRQALAQMNAGLNHASLR